MPATRIHRNYNNGEKNHQNKHISKKMYKWNN